jgi:hypothetical protein
MLKRPATLANLARLGAGSFVDKIEEISISCAPLPADALPAKQHLQLNVLLGPKSIKSQDHIIV